MFATFIAGVELVARDPRVDGGELVKLNRKTSHGVHFSIT